MSISEYYQQTREETFDKYRGVKGWLLVFVIGLVGVGPVITLINVIYTISSYNKVPFYLKTPTYLEIIITLGLMMFGATAGIALYSRTNRSAIKITKIYLLTAVIVKILIPVIFTFGFLSEFNDPFTPLWRDVMFSALVSLLATIIGATIWYYYLEKSKRVKATYSEEINEE